MALIKSISGIRGTIGGTIGEGLSPVDIVKFTAAYAVWVKQKTPNKKCKVVVGRDARISGEMVNYLVNGTLMGMGVNIVHIGLAATPTVEMAVIEENADGGIILTASHNPKEWNALKLLNEKGEFITDIDGKEILKIAENDSFVFSTVDELGKEQFDNSFTDKHIDKILKLPLVDVNAIKKANFKIVIDAVNSVGGTSIPLLLEKLGVQKVIKIHCNPNGLFPHNPEPLPEHLTDLSKTVVENGATLGFVVDPDVDRLAIVNEDGTMFGEEYTLVAVADYVLKNIKGNTVSNLSSTLALKDVTENHGCSYSASAVGEVNVVTEMKRQKAVIGGEGNGGIIYPELHYGRDSFVGIALFLTHLAKSGKKCSELRASYPNYFISKNKIQLLPQTNVDELLVKIQEKFKTAEISTIDGVKINFHKSWVHLRKSNTEPIIRIYAENSSEEAANNLAMEMMQEIKNLIH